MCLYEYDMVIRFLENREYFDSQGNIVILAIIYCIVMFCLKIILRQVQKTSVTTKYVSNVVTSVGGAGEKSMEFCLHVAETNLLLSNPCFHTRHTNSENCGEDCQKSTLESLSEFPDILSPNGVLPSQR